VESATKSMKRTLDIHGLRERLLERRIIPAGTRWRCAAYRNLHRGLPHLLLYERRGRHRPHRRDRGAHPPLGPCFSITPDDGSAKPRSAARCARYQRWLTHKLAGWWDEFGTSGCAGCGRCITWCPSGIDITQESAAIAGPEPLS
jgi:ferredoxin